FLSLLSLSLAAGSSPGAAAGSSSSRSSTPANGAGNRATVEEQTPPTPKNGKPREENIELPATGETGMTDPPGSNKPEPSDSDDPESPPGDGDDPTPTKTSKSTSKTTTAQRQRSTTFEAKYEDEYANVLVFGEEHKAFNRKTNDNTDAEWCWDGLG
ncbi:MAG: hypothetical protein L6R42_008642, partial [Xanthoria sp. 1 TBL-2021]